MSTSILILSPYPEERTTKAVNDCLARAEAISANAPTMEVFAEHPNPGALQEVL
jgi:hypothetical protein